MVSRILILPLQHSQNSGGRDTIMKKRKIVLVSILLFAIYLSLTAIAIIVIVRVRLSPKKKTEQIEEKKTRREKRRHYINVDEEVWETPAEIRISAEELYRDYEANEVAADLKYKDKIIQVSGEVQDIGKDILGRIYITLKTGEHSFWSVQCFFSKEWESSVAHEIKGSPASVRGKCTGKFGNIFLEGCCYDHSW